MRRRLSSPASSPSKRRLRPVWWLLGAGLLTGTVIYTPRLFGAALLSRYGGNLSADQVGGVLWAPTLGGVTLREKGVTVQAGEVAVNVASVDWARRILRVNVTLADADVALKLRDLVGQGGGGVAGGGWQTVLAGVEVRDTRLKIDGTGINVPNARLTLNQGADGLVHFAGSTADGKLSGTVKVGEKGDPPHNIYTLTFDADARILRPYWGGVEAGRLRGRYVFGAGAVEGDVALSSGVLRVPDAEFVTVRKVTGRAEHRGENVTLRLNGRAWDGPVTVRGGIFLKAGEENWTATLDADPTVAGLAQSLGTTGTGDLNLRVTAGGWSTVRVKSYIKAGQKAEATFSGVPFRNLQAEYTFLNRDGAQTPQTNDIDFSAQTLLAGEQELRGQWAFDRAGTLGWRGDFAGKGVDLTGRIDAKNRLTVQGQALGGDAKASYDLQSTALSAVLNPDYGAARARVVLAGQPDDLRATISGGEAGPLGYAGTARLTGQGLSADLTTTELGAARSDTGRLRLDLDPQFVGSWRAENIALSGVTLAGSGRVNLTTTDLSGTLQANVPAVGPLTGQLEAKLDEQRATFTAGQQRLTWNGESVGIRVRDLGVLGGVRVTGDVLASLPTAGRPLSATGELAAKGSGYDLQASLRGAAADLRGTAGGVTVLAQTDLNAPYRTTARLAGSDISGVLSLAGSGVRFDLSTRGERASGVLDGENLTATGRVNLAALQPLLPAGTPDLSGTLDLDLRGQGGGARLDATVAGAGVKGTLTRQAGAGPLGTLLADLTASLPVGQDKATTRLQGQVFPAVSVSGTASYLGQTLRASVTGPYERLQASLSGRTGELSFGSVSLPAQNLSVSGTLTPNLALSGRWGDLNASYAGERLRVSGAQTFTALGQTGRVRGSAVWGPNFVGQVQASGNLDQYAVSLSGPWRSLNVLARGPEGLQARGTATLPEGRYNLDVSGPLAVAGQGNLFVKGNIQGTGTRPRGILSVSDGRGGSGRLTLDGFENLGLDAQNLTVAGQRFSGRLNAAGGKLTGRLRAGPIDLEARDGRVSASGEWGGQRVQAVGRLVLPATITDLRITSAGPYFTALVKGQPNDLRGQLTLKEQRFGSDAARLVVPVQTFPVRASLSGGRVNVGGLGYAGGRWSGGLDAAYALHTGDLRRTGTLRLAGEGAALAALPSGPLRGRIGLLPALGGEVSTDLAPLLATLPPELRGAIQAGEVVADLGPQSAALRLEDTRYLGEPLSLTARANWQGQFAASGLLTRRGLRLPVSYGAAGLRIQDASLNAKLLRPVLPDAAGEVGLNLSVPLSAAQLDWTRASGLARLNLRASGQDVAGTLALRDGLLGGDLRAGETWLTVRRNRVQAVATVAEHRVSASGLLVLPSPTESGDLRGLRVNVAGPYLSGEAGGSLTALRGRLNLRAQSFGSGALRVDVPAQSFALNAAPLAGRVNVGGLGYAGGRWSGGLSAAYALQTGGVRQAGTLRLAGGGQVLAALPSGPLRGRVGLLPTLGGEVSTDLAPFASALPPEVRDAVQLGQLSARLNADGADLRLVQTRYLGQPLNLGAAVKWKGQLSARGVLTHLGTRLPFAYDGRDLNVTGAVLSGVSLRSVLPNAAGRATLDLSMPNLDWQQATGWANIDLSAPVQGGQTQRARGQVTLTRGQLAADLSSDLAGQVLSVRGALYPQARASLRYGEIAGTLTGSADQTLRFQGGGRWQGQNVAFTLTGESLTSASARLGLQARSAGGTNVNASATQRAGEWHFAGGLNVPDLQPFTGEAGRLSVTFSGTPKAINLQGKGSNADGLAANVNVKATQRAGVWNFVGGLNVPDLEPATGRTGRLEANFSGTPTALKVQAKSLFADGLKANLSADVAQRAGTWNFVGGLNVPDLQPLMGRKGRLSATFNGTPTAIKLQANSLLAGGLKANIAANATQRAGIWNFAGSLNVPDLKPLAGRTGRLDATFNGTPTALKVQAKSHFADGMKANLSANATQQAGEWNFAGGLNVPDLQPLTGRKGHLSATFNGTPTAVKLQAGSLFADGLKANLNADATQRAGTWNLAGGLNVPDLAPLTGRTGRLEATFSGTPAALGLRAKAFGAGGVGATLTADATQKAGAWNFTGGLQVPDLQPFTGQKGHIDATFSGTPSAVKLRAAGLFADGVQANLNVGATQRTGTWQLTGGLSVPDLSPLGTSGSLSATVGGTPLDLRLNAVGTAAGVTFNAPLRYQGGTLQVSGLSAQLPQGQGSGTVRASGEIWPQLSLSARASLSEIAAGDYMAQIGGSLSKPDVRVTGQLTQGVAGLEAAGTRLSGRFLGGAWKAELSGVALSGSLRGQLGSGAAGGLQTADLRLNTRYRSGDLDLALSGPLAWNTRSGWGGSLRVQGDVQGRSLDAVLDGRGALALAGGWGTGEQRAEFTGNLPPTLPLKPAGQLHLTRLDIGALWNRPDELRLTGDAALTGADWGKLGVHLTGQLADTAGELSGTLVARYAAGDAALSLTGRKVQGAATLRGGRYAATLKASALTLARVLPDNLGVSGLNFGGSVSAVGTLADGPERVSLQNVALRGQQKDAGPFSLYGSAEYDPRSEKLSADLRGSLRGGTLQATGALPNGLRVEIRDVAAGYAGAASFGEGRLGGRLTLSGPLRDPLVAGSFSGVVRRPAEGEAYDLRVTLGGRAQRPDLHARVSASGKASGTLYAQTTAFDPAAWKQTPLKIYGSLQSAAGRVQADLSGVWPKLSGTAQLQTDALPTPVNLRGDGSGTYVLNAGKLGSGAVRLTAQDGLIPALTGRLDLTPLALVPDAKGQARLTATLGGNLSSPTISADLVTSGVAVGGAELSDLRGTLSGKLSDLTTLSGTFTQMGHEAPVGTLRGQTLALNALNLRAAGSDLAVSGMADLGGKADLNVTASGAVAGNLQAKYNLGSFSVGGKVSAQGVQAALDVRANPYTGWSGTAQVTGGPEGVLTEPLALKVSGAYRYPLLTGEVGVAGARANVVANSRGAQVRLTDGPTATANGVLILKPDAAGEWRWSGGASLSRDELALSVIPRGPLADPDLDLTLRRGEWRASGKASLQAADLALSDGLRGGTLIWNGKQVKADLAGLDLARLGIRGLTGQLSATGTVGTQNQNGAVQFRVTSLTAPQSLPLLDVTPSGDISGVLTLREGRPTVQATAALNVGTLNLNAAQVLGTEGVQPHWQGALTGTLRQGEGRAEVDIRTAADGLTGGVQVMALPLNVSGQVLRADGTVALTGKTFSANLSAQHASGRARLTAEGGISDLLPALSGPLALPATGEGYSARATLDGVELGDFDLAPGLSGKVYGSANFSDGAATFLLASDAVKLGEKTLPLRVEGTRVGESWRLRGSLAASEFTAGLTGGEVFGQGTLQALPIGAVLAAFTGTVPGEGLVTGVARFRFPLADPLAGSASVVAERVRVSAQREEDGKTITEVLMGTGSLDYAERELRRINLQLSGENAGRWDVRGQYTRELVDVNARFENATFTPVLRLIPGFSGLNPALRGTLLLSAEGTYDRPRGLLRAENLVGEAAGLSLRIPQFAADLPDSGAFTAGGTIQTGGSIGADGRLDVKGQLTLGKLSGTVATFSGLLAPQALGPLPNTTLTISQNGETGWRVAGQSQSVNPATGAGLLTLSGDLTPRLDLRVRADNYNLPVSAIYARESALTGEFRVRDGGDFVRVSGEGDFVRLTLGRVDAPDTLPVAPGSAAKGDKADNFVSPLPEELTTFKPLTPAGEPVAPAAPPFAERLLFDGVRLRASGGIRLDENLVRAEFSTAGLTVSGTGARPLITGKIVSQRGSISLRENEFVITQSSVNFAGDGLYPSFSLNARGTVPSPTTGQQVPVALNVQGSFRSATGVLDLHTELACAENTDACRNRTTGNPYTQDELYALVATGVPDLNNLSSNLAGLGSSALQTALNVFFLGELERTLARGLGVDVIRLTPALGADGSVNATFTVGSYLTRDLFVQYQVDLTGRGLINATYSTPDGRFTFKVSTPITGLDLQSVRPNFSADYNVNRRLSFGVSVESSAARAATQTTTAQPERTQLRFGVTYRIGAR